MLAPATCENIVCEDPIDLFGTNHKVLGEDGTCPTKVIMGKLYDFRCYFCKILPRVGMANRLVSRCVPRNSVKLHLLPRSELYRHYSVMHYTAELKAEFGTKGKCPLCHKEQKQGSYVSHMGQVHDEVRTISLRRTPLTPSSLIRCTSICQREQRFRQRCRREREADTVKEEQSFCGSGSPSLISRTSLTVSNLKEKSELWLYLRR